MTAASQLRSVASLVVAVAIMIGLGLMGKRWIEQNALTSVLGPGASAIALKLHLKHNAGCAEDVRLSLTTSNDPGLSRFSTLKARRLWFTYDLNALLGKRLRLKHVVMDDVLIDCIDPVRGTSETLASKSNAVSDRATDSDWPALIRRTVCDLRQDRHLTQLKSHGLAEEMVRFWQAEAEKTEERAKSLLEEARQIQATLYGLDNPLRHEPLVITSGARLESLSGELDRMLNEFANVDKRLRSQQSDVRRALLEDKEALKGQGEKLGLPAVHPYAKEKMSDWIRACMNESTAYVGLMATIINKPFHSATRTRGRDIRHAHENTFETSVESAKIVGEIQEAGLKLPFSASGSFQVFHRVVTANENLTREGSHWQMSIGYDPEIHWLEGRSLETRSGTASIKSKSTTVGQLEAEYILAPTEISGSGKVQLRQWLASHTKDAPNDAELIPISYGDSPGDRRIILDKAPDILEFQFRGVASEIDISFEPDVVDWLAVELEASAAHCVAQEHVAAIDRLTNRVESELHALQRSAYDSQDRAQALLKQAREGLKIIRIGIEQSWVERNGNLSARQPNAKGTR